jgi:hypothetical protein
MIIPNIWKNKTCSKPPTSNGVSWNHDGYGIQWIQDGFRMDMNGL